MRVTVNGEGREVNDEATITALLGALGLSSERVAVERNREVVPRARHAETRLAEGDHLEIVRFVGGG